MSDPYEETKRLYRDIAGAWDAQRNRALFERKWLDKVLERCGPSPDILYLGCGAGEPVARYLIDAGARITGVDFAPEMLAIATRRFPDHEWVESDIRTYDPDTRFDAIVMWSVLFHLTQDDQRAMFPRFAAMIEPGAPILIQTGITAGEGQGTVEGRPVYHATLDEADYRKLFEANGFTDIVYVPEDAGAGGFTLWLASRRRFVSQPA